VTQKSLKLETMAPCFQGLFPAMLYTCSADGVPNAAYLSHVDYVDPGHVALSFQFFNKSKRNISQNPRATVAVIDPDTGQGWQLQLRYVRSESPVPSSSGWRCASKRSRRTAD
jgi:adenylate cyclase